MIKEKELLEIEKRCKSTTLGPWLAYIEGRDYTSGCHFIMTGPKENRGEDFEIDGARIDDYDFIAHAKQDIPRMIKEIRRLNLLIEKNGKK